MVEAVVIPTVVVPGVVAQVVLALDPCMAFCTWLPCGVLGMGAVGRSCGLSNLVDMAVQSMQDRCRQDN